jgi:hypothetical protein
MAKNGIQNMKTTPAKAKKNPFPWQQVLFASFALLIVISMILSAFM